MTDEFDEQLQSRLEGLSAGVEHARLPGAAAARARGVRRTRRQVAGGALTAAVVVAAGIAGVAGTGAFTGPDRAPPAAASSPAQSSARAGTPAPTLALATGVPPEALMTADDVEGGGAWTRSDADDADGDVTGCEPDLLARGSQGVASVDLTAGEGNRVHQEIARVGGADESDDVFTNVRQDALSCLPEQSSGRNPRIVNEGEVSGVGDEGWLVQYYVDPVDRDAPTVTLAVIRYDDALSMTVDVEPTRETTGDVDVATPAAAAGRMCDVMFNADCVDDPAFDAGPGVQLPTPGDPSEAAREPAGPLLDLADDPLLASDDVGPVGTYEGFVAHHDQPPAPYAHTCVTDLDDVGADTLVHGRWSQELGEGGLAEHVVRMPDVEGARRLITDHTVLPEQCGDVGETREQIVGEPAYAEVDGADDALVWTVNSRPLPSDPGSEPSFTGVGMARSGNVVVVVTFGAFGDPTDGDWTGYATRTLGLALQRALP